MKNQFDSSVFLFCLLLLRHKIFLFQFINVHLSFSHFWKGMAPSRFSKGRSPGRRTKSMRISCRVFHFFNQLLDLTMTSCQGVIQDNLKKILQFYFSSFNKFRVFVRLLPKMGFWELWQFKLNLLKKLPLKQWDFH